MTSILQALLDGVLTGGTYALLAAGLALIFGVLRIVNFAQADFMMLAMFLTFALVADVGFTPLLVVPIAFLVFYVVGRVVHLGLIDRVAGRNANVEAQVILTLGLGTVLQNTMLLAFSASPRVVPGDSRGGWEVGAFYVSEPRLLAFAVAVVVALGLYLFLQRTRQGRAIRATASDWEASTYMGIDIHRTQRMAFGIGIGLTAVGGVMLSTYQPLGPFVGLEFITVMFVAVIVGGLGSIKGALVGGIVIGIVQSVSTVWSSPQLSNAYVFVLLLLVLTFRPQGLFGKAVRGV